MVLVITIKEIFQMILLVILLLIPTSVGVIYFSADFPKMMLINHELKNTLDLFPENKNIEVKYTLDDNQININKDETKLTLSKGDIKMEQPTYSKNSKITKDANTITIIS